MIPYFQNPSKHTFLKRNSFQVFYLEKIKQQFKHRLTVLRTTNHLGGF